MSEFTPEQDKISALLAQRAQKSADYEYYHLMELFEAIAPKKPTIDSLREFAISIMEVSAEAQISEELRSQSKALRHQIEALDNIMNRIHTD